MTLYIGTSGYTYPAWISRFYPGKMDAKKMFQYYVAQFNTVEINYTFYHTPKASTVSKWHDQAPAGFKYTLKVPRVITHLKKLTGCREHMADFNRLSALLKEKLGIILLQLPPSFRVTGQNVEKVKRTFQYLDRSLAYAIEFRHPSWFGFAGAQDLCRENRVAFCAVSAPGLGFDPVVTSRNVYIRMHGKERWYDYDYPERELGELAGLIRGYLRQELDVWVYFNNDNHAYAPKNALRLKQMLRRDMEAAGGAGNG